jgi:hypothetical protein
MQSLQATMRLCCRTLSIRIGRAGVQKNLEPAPRYLPAQKLSVGCWLGEKGAAESSANWDPFRAPSRKMKTNAVTVRKRTDSVSPH